VALTIASNTNRLSMPSIEILAVGQIQPIGVDHLPFAVHVDAKRSSHRRPSRFQHDFDQLTGILYHLGNPSLKHDSKGRFYIASRLLTVESKKLGAEFLEFVPEHRVGVESLLSDLVLQTPARQLVFTSDWQFGPDWVRREGPMTLEEFWHAHDSRQILLNALYPISVV
jgi:hypothetical protein